ncbi:MAG: sensor histidine kinase [Pigmentiphaga sp.]
MTEPVPGRRPLLPELLRHGLTTLAICLLITAALTWAGHNAWHVNLVYSLAIGTISWLTIDLGCLWWTRESEIRWPPGWRGPTLVAAGIVLGFSVGSAIGYGYQTHIAAIAPPTTVQVFWIPILLTMTATVVTSAGFYLLGKASHLQAQMAEARREAAEARLTLLRAQLDPHMLFNTLANLQTLIATDARRAQTMLEHLTRYLRATLDGSRGPEHTLRDEFALLRDYLELMTIRMGPRLRHSLELPDALADAVLPPLLLQPLVENAIRHGLEPRIEGGRVWVRARAITSDDGARLELVVGDDGHGLSAPSRPLVPEGSGFGTAQIRERLASRYGEQARFELTSPPGGGTIARIELPWHSL